MSKYDKYFLEVSGTCGASGSLSNFLERVCKQYCNNEPKIRDNILPDGLIT